MHRSSPVRRVPLSKWPLPFAKFALARAKANFDKLLIKQAEWSCEQSNKEASTDNNNGQGALGNNWIALIDAAACNHFLR